MQEQIKESYSYIFFINKRSGSHLSENLIKELDKIKKGPQSLIIDLSGSELSMNLNVLKHQTKQLKQNFRVIACGGDGTISWVISLLIKYEISFPRIVLGVIPFGTGNDFARHCRWNHLNSTNLNQIFKEFQNKSKIQSIDLWKAKIQAEGKFQQVKNIGGKAFDQTIQTQSIQRVFINYLSFGMDARVSYYFQRNRASCATCNLCCYCLLGFKNFFKPIPNIGRLINKLYVKGRQTKYPQQNLHLLFQNINSYMGGVLNIWQQSRANHPGFLPQKSDDSQLECLSFKNQLSLGLQRMCKGGGYAIQQSNGPFEIQFIQKQQEWHTYIQMDGQNLRVYNPSKLSISKWGEIQVLVRIQQKN